MAGTIINGSEHFFTNIYEGNGQGQKVGRFVPFTDSGTISNSCVFDKNGPDYYSKTQGSGGTSTKKFTFSCWFKLGNYALAGTSGYFPALFNVGNETGKYFSLFYQSQYKNFQYYSYQSTYDARGITVRTFEDTSKWYHIVIAADTTDSTAGDRVKLYIDGERITSFTNAVNPSLNYDFSVGAAEPYNLGFINSGDTWDGYIAEANYVDGTAYTPSTFGLTDTSTGRWIPKTLSGISYGTLGYRLNFSDASSDAAMGTDSSGNSHTFTLNGNLAATSQTTDSPTKNFATLTGDTAGTLSLGNLKLVTNNTGYNVKHATLKPKTGKWYMEVTVNAAGYAIVGVQGVATMPVSSSSYFPISYGFGWYQSNGNVYDGSNAVVASGATYTTNDVLGIALDLDNQEVKFYKNNTLNNTIGLDGTHVAFTIADFANSYNAQLTANFGGRGFTHTPPSGFKALQQDNLPDEGKGIPDLVWIKNRDASDSHQLYDSTRGPRIDFNPDGNAVESTTADGLQKFIKGGCQIEDDVSINTNAESYVSWNWVANNGVTATNTNGSINSTVQANQTAGFSIVQYTGNGGNVAATIGHGLSQAPDWILLKFVDTTGHWSIYHKSLGNTKRLKFNTDAPQTDSTLWNNTSPTSTVFHVGSSYNQSSVYDYIAYCFHEVPGFSRFGEYFGNGNSEGPFIYTGFKPAWVMIKRYDSATGGYWSIQDNTRVTVNPKTTPLLADTTGAESGLSAATMDFLFKWIQS